MSTHSLYVLVPSKSIMSEYSGDVLTAARVPSPTLKALPGLITSKEKNSEKQYSGHVSKPEFVPSPTLNAPPGPTVSKGGSENQSQLPTPNPTATPGPFTNEEKKNPEEVPTSAPESISEPTPPPTPPAPVPSPTSAPRSAVRAPRRASTQRARTSYPHDELGPLANAGDFYRVVPGFSYSSTSGPNSHPPAVTNAFPSFPSYRTNAVAPIHLTDGGLTHTHSLAANRAAEGLPPSAVTSTPPINSSQGERRDMVTEANSSFSSSPTDLRSSIVRTASLVATSGITSGNVRSEVIPPSEYGRGADLYGIPQDAVSHLSSAIYTVPGGTGAKGATGGSVGVYHGAPEPMDDVSSAPARQMEITAEPSPHEFELSSPMSTFLTPASYPLQREEKTQPTVRELYMVCGCYQRISSG